MKRLKHAGRGSDNRFNRRHLRFIVPVVAIALLVAGWLAWDAFFAQPTANDFRQTRTDVFALKESVSTIDRSSSRYLEIVVASLRTQQDMTKEVSQYRNDYETAVSRHDELISRIERSKSVREDTVLQSVNEVVKQDMLRERFFGGLTSGYSDFYRTYISCDDVYRFVATGNKAADSKAFSNASKDCVNDLETLSKQGKLELMKDYASTRREVVLEQRTAYEKGDSAALTKANAKSQLFDPLGQLQRERAKATSTSAIDNSVKVLDGKINQAS